MESPLISKLLTDAVRAGDIPGGVAVIGSRSGRQHPVARGVRKLDGPETTADTRYDLASLTKVVATLPCIVRLVSDRELTLDDPVRKFISNAGWFQTPSLADTTIRELLTHTSGLASWRPVYACTSDRQTAFGNVLQSSIGERGPIVYSDLGFLVLGAIIERVTKLRQDAFAERHVFGPLGMNATGYRAVSSTLAGGVPIAASEDCGWRNKLLEGVVHDENAFRADGVAGHAGLFGTAPDLATYAEAWLALDRRLGSEAVLVDTMREHAGDGKARRGLGWLMKGVDSFSGNRSTADGVGHTGFTGTSLWLEPGAGWYAVLLTNRVHPSRERGARMHALRREFHDAAYDEVMPAGGAQS